jgi:hypothetical protein
MIHATRLSLLLIILWLGGCASLDQPPERLSAAQQACWQAFVQLDAALAAGVGHDVGEHRIPGFPYLRSNRLLASFADELEQPDQLDSWLSQLAELDSQARRLELMRHHPDALEAEQQARQLDHCRAQLLAADRLQPERLAQLKQASQVPDDYLSHWRVLGLYPLTGLGIRWGIRGWHRETRETYATPLETLPVSGQLQRWASPAQDAPDRKTIAQWLSDSHDPLGIPQPDPAQQQALFTRFAPVWEVDVVDEHDRIGGFYWDHGARLDRHTPTEYRHLSHTRLGGQTLLQLNYLIWFPARPGNDIYAGWLDGIHWRVTLGSDGRPLIYDSIHPCGCYHLFFPTRTLQWREGQPRAGLEEPALSPQTAPDAQRLVIRIGHGRHYIERLYPNAAHSSAIPLQIQPYDRLRALPSEHGHHSLFGPHGLVPGSERPERLLFWPMGIRSAGAMRQWGRHATAFIGRRHFDEAWLFEPLFEPPDEELRP